MKFKSGISIFLACLFLLTKGKDLGGNMLFRLCSDCLPFLQIGLFEANIDIFLDLLSCHHLARLFEVVFRRNLQKYVRGKLKIRDDFVLCWPWNCFRLVRYLYLHLSLPYFPSVVWQSAHHYGIFCNCICIYLCLCISRVLCDRVRISMVLTEWTPSLAPVSRHRILSQPSNTLYPCFLSASTSSL